MATTTRNAAQGILSDENRDKRDEIIGLLERLWREHGLTTVLVTHDSGIARRAQRIGVMARGRLSIREEPAQQPSSVEEGSGEQRRPAALSAFG